MATGGRRSLLLLVAASLGTVGIDTFAADPSVQRASYSASGQVVMPHPNACACNNEEKTHREKLWDKLRPGHRDRYVTQQHVRHLNHPECPPYCVENFGYYQTCWRRFPEDTLACRYCWDGGSPPLPAAPLRGPQTTVPMAPPAANVRELSPPALPTPAPAELKTDPPPESNTPPAVEQEVEDVKPKIVPTGGWWNDPEWQAGLRRPSISAEGIATIPPSKETSPNFNDPAWKAGLRPAR